MKLVHDLCERAASHFHNPHNIKRPQAKKSGPAKKPTMPVVSVTAQDASRVTNSQQHGIDYYRSTADDDASILEERRQRQYDERQRKKEQKKFQKQHGYWNPTAPLKPERYSNLKAYRASGGYARKKQDFDAFLQQAAKKKSREASEASNSSRPASSSSDQIPAPAMKKPSFAPPASYDPATASPPADMQAEEDPYARRIRLSQQQHAPPPPPPSQSASAPPPPLISATPGTSASAVYQGVTISGPPVRYANATISAPPVRYEHPDVPMGDADEPAYDERPAKRPKISKAEAMMAKMGYVKGQGLGKNNDGVVTHLEVKKRKEQQKGSTFDEDGGKVKSQQVWDVRGGMRTQQDEPGKFGEESTVVVAWGCIDGIDWDENAQRNDGGIRQDLGEVLGAKVCLQQPFSPIVY